MNASRTYGRLLARATDMERRALTAADMLAADIERGHTYSTEPLLRIRRRYQTEARDARATAADLAEAFHLL